MCDVPFTSADLGEGVWRTLTDDAAKEHVVMKVRGCKSSGHKEKPKDFRKLSVYGADPSAVQMHFMKVHDAAVDAGVDPDKPII